MFQPLFFLSISRGCPSFIPASCYLVPNGPGFVVYRFFLFFFLHSSLIGSLLLSRKKNVCRHFGAVFFYWTWVNFGPLVWFVSKFKIRRLTFSFCCARVLPLALDFVLFCLCRIGEGAGTDPIVERERGREREIKKGGKKKKTRETRRQMLVQVRLVSAGQRILGLGLLGCLALPWRPRPRPLSHPPPPPPPPPPLATPFVSGTRKRRRIERKRKNKKKIKENKKKWKETKKKSNRSVSWADAIVSVQSLMAR